MEYKIKKDYPLKKDENYDNLYEIDEVKIPQFPDTYIIRIPTKGASFITGVLFREKYEKA